MHACMHACMYACIHAYVCPRLDPSHCPSTQRLPSCGRSLAPGLLSLSRALRLLLLLALPNAMCSLQRYLTQTWANLRLHVLY